MGQPQGRGRQVKGGLKTMPLPANGLACHAPTHWAKSFSSKIQLFDENNQIAISVFITFIV
jgi:hypothetical protein